jgi:hypothetical protein
VFLTQMLLVLVAEEVLALKVLTLLAQTLAVLVV